MSIHAIRDALARQPFEPFRVILSSGDAYEVRHPVFTWLIRGGLYVGLPAEGRELPDRAVYCSALHIAAVETLTTA